jgi:hypothetical protein
MGGNSMAERARTVFLRAAFFLEIGDNLRAALSSQPFKTPLSCRATMRA